VVYSNKEKLIGPPQALQSGLFYEQPDEWLESADKTQKTTVT
jgi:hypothetical protein